MKKNIVDQGKHHFKNGWYCAESVLLAVSDAAGIKSDIIPKIATGFCAGLGRTNGICGAVTGGIMAINLLTGRSNPQDSVDDNYKLVELFQQNFKQSFQSINCFELTGCDFTVPEGHTKFDEENMGEKCTQMVGTAVEHVLDLFKTFEVAPFKNLQ